jgi:myosin heavy subunit
MRKRSANDSLDLLLDTICNTFGGIVFLSILVVLLADSGTSDAPPKPDMRRLIENRRNLAKSSAKLESLRREAQQVEKLKKLLTDAETESLLQEMIRQQQSADRLQRKRDSDLGNLADSQVQINQTVEELQRLRKDIAATRERRSAAEQRLKEEQAVRSRTSELPRARETTKKQVGFFLKNGELCAYTAIDASGNLKQNAVESKVEISNGRRFAGPIAGKGLTVDLQGKNSKAIAAKFAKFDKDKHFLTMVVWGDSFEQFSTVKETIVRLGFKYQFLPQVDEKIPLGLPTETQRVQ